MPAEQDMIERIKSYERVNIDFSPKIPPLKKEKDKTLIDVRYCVISPYAFIHIYWDTKIYELIYEVEEPILTEEEKKFREQIIVAMRDMINFQSVVGKNKEALLDYIDKRFKILAIELGLDISYESYKKIYYYLCRDFMGFNEIEPILRDYFIEDIECNGINSPIYVVHRIFRNLKSNVLFKTNAKLEGFVEKLAQRCGKYVSYARPILDGSLPDGSVDYEEPVIYKEKGIIKISKIGEVIDKFYKEKETDKPVKVEFLEVPAFDKKKLKISWKKVDYIYRHKINEDIYEIKTEYGKRIKLTGCHSIFGLMREGIKPIRTDNLKEGDYVAFPISIPSGNVIKSINLADSLCKAGYGKKFVLINIPEEVYNNKKHEIYKFFRDKYKKPNQAWYEHKNKKILPLEMYKLIPEEQLEKMTIGTTSNIKIKSILKINKNLARFLGLYIAEGWLTHVKNHYRVEFCVNKSEINLIEDLRRTIKECFGCDIYVEPEYNNAVKVVINSFILWAVLKDVLKISVGAKNKRVPEIIFNSPREVQEEFLKAWFDGDFGSTASKQLAEDISYLFSMIGKTVSFYNRERISNLKERKIKSCEYYTNSLRRKIENSYSSMIPVTTFNPLTETHIGLRNIKINRERLRGILSDERYRRMKEVSEGRLYNIPKQFIIEWIKRGFIKENKLTEKGKDLLREIDNLKKITESDLGFAKIISIRKVKPSREYVYDFSVKECENFLGGFGGLCCHNSRVNATYTKDITSRGPTFTIRKFTKTPWTPPQLLSFGTLSPEMLAYLWILVQYRMSLLITGGTASGKTTLLNAVAFFIPPEARVISIEDTRELNLPRENWLPSVVREATGVGDTKEIDLFTLLRSSFRQHPDYVIVGEVRGKEAFVLFQGMASGHSSISTMHADSVDTLIKRLETPPIELSPTLLNILDVVLVMTHAIVKQQETRKLKEIVEIINVNEDGTAVTNTPFNWSPLDDKFYSKRGSKIFEKISARYGVRIDDLELEFRRRVAILYKLYQNKIFGFEEIQDIINEYYKKPEEVLKRFGIQ